MSLGDSSPRYAVRVTARADRDAVEAFIRLEELEGQDIARRWYTGLFAAAGQLADQP